MADTVDIKFLDKRTADRYMRTGLLDEKDWDKHLKGLPDLAEKAVSVESTMFEDEEVDAEDEAVEEAAEAPALAPEPVSAEVPPQA